MKKIIGILVLVITLFSCRPDDIDMYNIHQGYKSLNDTIRLETSIYYTSHYNEHDGFFNIGRMIYSTTVKTINITEIQSLRDIEKEKAKMYIYEDIILRDSKLENKVQYNGK